MLFSIDVRNKICKKHQTWMEYVTLKADIDLLKDEEKDAELKSKLELILNQLQDVADIKKKELSKEIHDFEEEFVKDITEHKDWYVDMILK